MRALLLLVMSLTGFLFREDAGYNWPKNSYMHGC
jgi:hypothetical protein